MNPPSLPHPLPYLAAWLVSVSPLASAWAQVSDPVTAVYPKVEILETGKEHRQFEKVEITGSSIIRKEQTMALPVQVITRDDIRRSGSSSMTEVLQNLPTMSMVVTSAAMTITIGGYTTASLRSLPAGTLLLLNGKRLSPFGRQTVVGDERPSVEINTIPISAIDKIEILSDGASSLYGSDAIAGVINIITRPEHKGVEIVAEKLDTFQGGGRGEQITLNAGLGQLSKDGYSVRLTAEAYHRDALQTIDRPQYAQGRYVVERNGQNYAIDGSRVTSYAAPGIFSVPANATPGQPAKSYSWLYQDGQCPENYLTVIGRPACRYNTYSTYAIYPQQDSRKILLAGEKFLGNGMTGYAEILYSAHDDSEFAGLSWAQRTFKIGTSPTSVGYQEAIAAGLIPSQVQYLWSPISLEALKRANEQRNWRWSTGVKGAWQDWDYQVNVYRAQANVTQRQEAVDLTAAGFVNNQIMTDPNLLKPLTPDNPLTAKLNGLRSVWVDMDKGRTQTTSAHLQASRPLMEIDGQEVMLGVGAEWRREAADFEYISGSVAQPSFQAKRDIKAGYLELQVPVTPQWEVTASSRIDHYSDVGQTQNNKLSSRFDFENGWSARASLGTGFRAPSLAQVQDYDLYYFLGSTPFQNECGPDMLALVARMKKADGSPAQCTKSAINVYGMANPDIKPELSKQKSLGLAFRPTRNFSITADWWSIHMNDVITTVSNALVYADPLRYAQYYFIARSTGLLTMRLPNYNMGQREKSGVDFDVRWRAPTDWGQWNLFAQGTYNIKSQNQADPSQPFSSDLARYNIMTDSITPRLRMRWIAGLTTPEWSLHGVVNHTSGYVDQDRTGVNVLTGQSVKLTGFSVPSFTTLDVNASVQLHKALSLRASVGNLLNKQAPQAFTTTTPQVFGFNSRDHNLWGRTLSVALVGKF